MSDMQRRPDTVPFGKYKGQPPEALLADKSYMEWLLAQPWFREKFATFHQVIINYGAEPQDSPEHNEMQASFLDDTRCMRLARLLWPGRKWDMRKAIDLDPQTAGWLEQYPQTFTARWHDTEPKDRKFEVDGWDVTYGIQVPYVEIITDPHHLPPCTCAPCDHAACASDATCRPKREDGPHPFDGLITRSALCLKCGAYANHPNHSTFRPPCKHHGHDRRAVNLGAYAGPNSRISHMLHCDATCPHADLILNSWLNTVTWHGVGPSWHGNALIEIKPDLGDDFPTVLRQILRYPRTGSDRACVIVRRNRFTTVTWDQVEAMFAAQNIKLIKESDLNPVRVAIDTGRPLEPDRII